MVKEARGTYLTNIYKICLSSGRHTNKGLCEFRGNTNSTEKLPWWRQHYVMPKDTVSDRQTQSDRLPVRLSDMQPNGTNIKSPIIEPM